MVIPSENTNHFYHCEIDRSTEHKNSAEKDLTFLDDMQGLSRTWNSTCSNDLLRSMVQVEELIQRQKTPTIKKHDI